jgi:hypothetical protein
MDSLGMEASVLDEDEESINLKKVSHDKVFETFIKGTQPFVAPTQKSTIKISPIKEEIKVLPEMYSGVDSDDDSDFEV